MRPEVAAAIAAVASAAVTAGGAVIVALITRKRTPDPPPAPSIRASAASLPGIIPGRPRILVVDDEPSFARALRHALAEHGFDVDTAGSCADARTLAALHPYALLVVDLRLPDGDGLALLSELRMRTLIYSGATEEQLDAARATGMADRVLDKDGDLDAVEAVVVELVERR